MRLALVSLTSGGLSGGCRKYLLRMVPLLLQDSRISRLHLILHEKHLLYIQQLLQSTDVHALTFGGLRPAHKIRRIVSQLSPDVVLMTTQRWVSTGLPTALMIRNMEAVARPFGGNPWNEVLRNLARRLATLVACRKATRVIAISEFVRRFLIERWHIQPEKIGLVYHGVDWVEPAADGQLPAALYALRGSDFLLSVGAIRPYRGLEDVVQAMGLLSSEFSGLRLVIAGEVDPRMDGYRSNLQRLAERWNVADRLVWPGFLPERVLAWCYRNCRVFVMTTRVEACPNAALEAMHNGCLSVVTSADPLPEFFQQNAFYYPPGDGRHLAEQLRKALLLDDSQRTAMVEGLRRRAAEFTWQRTAQQTIAELEKTLQQDA